MKGSPIFRTLAAVVGLVLIGILLFQMTHTRPPISTVSAETAHPSTSVPTLVRIRASHRPQTLTLRQETQVIADIKSPQHQEWEIDSSLAIPADGAELVLEATWEDGLDHAAVTVELQPDTLEAKLQTEWSDAGELKAFLLFRWP